MFPLATLPRPPQASPVPEMSAMAALRWVASLALVGSLASCSPQVRGTTNGVASTASVVHRSADRAEQFVAGLIVNATEAEQRHQARHPRFPPCFPDESLIVDLGYARYRGYYDPSTGLNYWKGSGLLSQIPKSMLLLTASWPLLQNPLRCPTHRESEMATTPSASPPDGCSRYRRDGVWAHLPSVVAGRPQCGLSPGKRGLPILECLRAPECNQPPCPGVHP